LRFIIKSDEYFDLPAGKGRFIMNKERLEWVMSGLNRYKLTQKEDQFIKSAEQDFNQKSMLTEQQEGKLESLYKEKSRFLPNRNYFSPKESNKIEKIKAKRSRPKFIPQ
jgi:DNA repair ATPase RecN